MSSALSRFGVPMPDGRQQMKQPKPKHRFRVIMWGFGRNQDGEKLTLETDSVTLPSVTYEKNVVDSYNSKDYYKGKPEWSTCDLVVRDTIDNASFRAVCNQMQKEFDHYRQIQQTSAADYKFEMWIQTLDGSDTGGMFDGTHSTFVCEGCLIETFSFGELNYADSSHLQMTMTIQPANCIMLDSNGNAMAEGVIENAGSSPYLSNAAEYGDIGDIKNFDDEVTNGGRTFFRD